MPYISPSVAAFTNETLDIDFGFAAQTGGFGTGLMPSDPDLVRGFPDYAASHPIYPRSEWAGRIEQNDKAKAWASHLIAFGHDQGSEPSCVYNMLASITEVTWNRMFGTENAVNLSAMSGYRWNGSPRSGSNIFASAGYSEGTGLLPANDSRNLALVQKGYFKHTHPHNGYSNSFQDGWKETAASFRLQEWFRHDSVESWVSALIDGHTNGGGRDGHAIMHPLLAWDSGKLYSIYLNSWGSWGNTLEIAGGKTLKSFGVDSESKISSMIRSGAYCGRTLRRPSWFPLGVAL